MMCNGSDLDVKVASKYISETSIELPLENVTLKNFGPYGSSTPVAYPLSRRGLVLLRGQASDGTGADSDGAGKVIIVFESFFIKKFFQY